MLLSPFLAKPVFGFLTKELVVFQMLRMHKGYIKPLSSQIVTDCTEWHSVSASLPGGVNGCKLRTLGASVHVVRFRNDGP